MACNDGGVTRSGLARSLQANETPRRDVQCAIVSVSNQYSVRQALAQGSQPRCTLIVCVLLPDHLRLAPEMRQECIPV